MRSQLDALCLPKLILKIVICIIIAGVVILFLCINKVKNIVNNLNIENTIASAVDNKDITENNLKSENDGKVHGKIHATDVKERKASTEVLTKFFTALENKDAKELKKLFSKSAQKDIKDLDKKINKLIKFYKGANGGFEANIDSRRKSKQKKIINPNIFIMNDDYEYRINIFFREGEGIYLINAVYPDKVPEEYMYHGYDDKAGIYINK